MTDKEKEAAAYLARCRTSTPAVYNMTKSGGRTSKQTELLSANEYNSAITTNFTVVNNRFDVKKEKFCDEISTLRNRIVAHSTDGLDDSDIEFLQNEIDDSDCDDEIDGAGGIGESEAESANHGDTESNRTINSENGVIATANSTYVTADEVDSNIDANGSQANQMQSSAEVDHFSGTIPFAENDFNDRYYKDYDVGVRSAIVECLSAWNKSRPFSTVIYDKRFIGVLLKEVFREELGSLKDLDEKRLVFIKRVFDIRVDGDNSRASKFDSIVAEKHENAKNRCRANSIDDA